MNNPEQHSNGASSYGNTGQKHLTKDEMREKIKASLAAKEASDVSAGTSYAASERLSGRSYASDSRSRSEKARQIREAVASKRTEDEAQSEMRGNSYRQASYSGEPPRRQAAPKQSESTAPRQSQTHSYYADEDPTTRHSGSRTASRGNGSRTGIIIAIVILAILLLGYIAGLAVYHGKFLPNTIVNGVDIGGMTAEDAQTAVLETAEEMGVTFLPKSGDAVTFKGSSFGYTVTLAGTALTEPADESHALWFKKLFSETEYTVSMQSSYSEDALVSLIAAYDWGNVPPTDAKIVQNEDGSFSIQAEDDGNMVDTTKLSDYTIAQLREGNSTIQMADSDCYKKAAVTAESLEPSLALYNKIGKVEITYDMTDREEIFDPVGTEKLDHTTIMDWISTDSGEITVDTDKATAWVQENIADKYDTLVTGYTWTFDSTEDGTIQLPIGTDGIYGWKTNVSATVDKLVEYIKAGDAVTIEPVYKVEGFRMNSTAGVTYTGNTYIEVDICHQHLWYYVNGELYLESDCVTGLASDPERATPPGAYKVWSRESPRKLGTYAVQGYETWVEYWMPVTYTGIGLHDLSRSAYGGEIYKTNGSHGCINLPLDIAKQIYEKVTVNTPVMIIP